MKTRLYSSSSSPRGPSEGATGRIVRWEGVAGPGLEHLRLHTHGGEVVAESVVLGTTSEGRPFRCRYAMHLDTGWRVARVELHDDVGELVLRRDRDGLYVERGAPGASLEGCVDVDLSGTPFTNTLPIRRLELAVGESREVLVAYIAMPGLQAAPVRQRYTRLGPDRGPKERYRYESLASGFVAEILVDDEGLVVEYPGLFRRVD